MIFLPWDGSQQLVTVRTPLYEVKAGIDRLFAGLSYGAILDIKMDAP